MNKSNQLSNLCNLSNFFLSVDNVGSKNNEKQKIYFVFKNNSSTADFLFIFFHGNCPGTEKFGLRRIR